MSKKPVKDVFGFWKIKNADFVGKYEFPIINGTSEIPEALVLFTNCEKELKPENKAVHFYQYDENFVSCIDSEVKLTKKLKTLKKYQSVILPDYSVYRDMPLAQQIFQVYKSRAIGNFLMQNGIKIIPNVRWGDERTYEFAFDGIEKYGVIAVGIQGAYRDNKNEYFFEKGFYKMLDILDPESILCYGKLSNGLQSECNLRKINIIEYQTEISNIPSKTDTFQMQLEFDD